MSPLHHGRELGDGIDSQHGLGEVGGQAGLRDGLQREARVWPFVAGRHQVNHRGRVEPRFGQAGQRVRKARARNREQDCRPARGTEERAGHETGSEFVRGHDRREFAAAQGLEQWHRLRAGHAEHVRDAERFQRREHRHSGIDTCRTHSCECVHDVGTYALPRPSRLRSDWPSKVMEPESAGRGSSQANTGLCDVSHAPA